MPRLARDEAVIPEPRVVPFNTDVPLIKYALPVDRFAEPAMSSALDELVVPMPTLPMLFTKTTDDTGTPELLAVWSAKSGMVEDEEVATTVRVRAAGSDDT